MTLKRKLELEAIVLVIIAVVVSAVVVVYRNIFQSQFSIAPDAPVAQVSVKVVAPKITTSSQISPDGTKTVIMEATQSADMTTYNISTVDEDNQSEILVFTQTLKPSDTMTIPFNTWSPNDKYFFVQQKVDDNKSIFVFKADGAEFEPGVTYLDVTDLFKKADTGNNFSEATGWASDTLIIINTIMSDNTKGPSYWFEVPSKAIIRLSSEF